MRVAICNWTNRRIGGTETYLGNVASFLSRHGHELAFFREVDVAPDRDVIPLPTGTPSFCAQELGRDVALRQLEAWAPDIIYVNIIEDTSIEAALVALAPAVFDAHAFYGTCVGQSKCFKFPTPTPCTRTFGWQCLLHYYPRRCGGLSPVTMVKRYRHESARNALLPRYRAVITHSEFMRQEYIRHGVAEDRAYNVSAGLVDQHFATPTDVARVAGDQAETLAHAFQQRPSVRLLFVGRMDHLKGGDVLLDALPAVQRAIQRPLHLRLAGAGPAREKWESHGRQLNGNHPNINISFIGWVSGSDLDDEYAATDLLVVPSLWPEPFGRIGLEAGRHGTPSAAFSVGGIPDWLTDGVNGHLAPGNPPTSQGLARAIIECLIDPSHHASLRLGAQLRSQGGGRGGSWPLINEIFARVGSER